MCDRQRDTKTDANVRKKGRQLGWTLQEGASRVKKKITFDVVLAVPDGIVVNVQSRTSAHKGSVVKP